jgi:ankyrin repeat protein
VLQKLIPVLEFIFIADVLPKTTACWKTLSSHGLLLELPFPGHCDVVELLLSRGIDVDLDSARGTPLQVAAMYKQHDTMKILLEHHANVRHRFLGSLIACAKENPALLWPFRNEYPVWD